MRAFVTGATGFVGSHLVDALLARGDEASCLVRNPAKAARVFPDRSPETVIGDLGDEGALRAGIEGADVVFHVAGVTSARNRAEFFSINTDATRRVLQAATDVAPDLQRFVLVSSLSAAGPTRSGQVLTEQDPPRPVSNYGESKLAGERIVMDGALPWTVIRPPAVYGPRDDELRRLFKFARLGLAPLFGDGSQQLTLIHVRDLVAALLAVPDSETTAGATYYASHPEILTAREFVTAIHAAVAKSAGKAEGDIGKPVFIPVPGWLTRGFLVVSGMAAGLAGRATMLSPDKGDELLAESWACSPSAIERDTGWAATIPYSEGVPETAQWYRHQGLL